MEQEEEVSNVTVIGMLAGLIGVGVVIGVVIGFFTYTPVSSEDLQRLERQILSHNERIAKLESVRERAANDICVNAGGELAVSRWGDKVCQLDDIEYNLNSDYQWKGKVDKTLK